MKQSESLEQFYQNNFSYSLNNESQEIYGLASGSFNVFRRNDFSCKNFISANRRDYYKISLIIGTGVLRYANRSVEILSNALLFSNPNIPYGWEATSTDQKGFFCVFTEEFLLGTKKADIRNQTSLFKIDGDPIYFLEDKSVDFLSTTYEKMIEEMDKPYPFKYDLMRSYTELIIHEALKIEPVKTFFREKDANFRIATLFSQLLEQQFPIGSKEDSVQLKTPGSFASQMSIHINHLNRAVKKITGKTTILIIAERTMQEAKALLQYTDWNISEIAYCLGFKEPAYFNNQFKKYTKTTPKAYRDLII